MSEAEHGGLATTVLGLVAACGGSGGGGDAPAPEAPAAPLYRTSADTPFAVACNGAQVGTVYASAEVEPFLVVNPASPANLIAIWQQDRWSNGAAQGLVVGASFDSGRSWTRNMPFSICAGGSLSQGGDFARASDPWLAVSADGALHALGLAVTGAALATNSEAGCAVLERRARWRRAQPLERSRSQLVGAGPGQCEPVGTGVSAEFRRSTRRSTQAFDGGSSA